MASADALSFHLSALLVTALILAFLAQIWLNRKLTLAPLATLRDNANRIAQGGEHLGKEISEPWSPELKDFTRAFNSMSVNLRKSVDGLEQQVERRTAELREKNAALENEITERKQAEEKLTASLREKEVLLREVHHRVKNNMQVVASLLRSQGRMTNNKQVLEVFEKSQNRISAMSMIHEALHQSPDLSKVNFDDYLKKLVGNLCQANDATVERIGWTVDVADVSLGIDQAVPFGLLINELISNTFKHAFPGDRRGKIRLSLSSDDEGEISLEVSDDGIGLPEDLDIRNTDTLGFELVVGLAEQQLRGSIAVDRTAGTKFLIRFKPDDSGERI